MIGKQKQNRNTPEVSGSIGKSLLAQKSKMIFLFIKSTNRYRSSHRYLSDVCPFLFYVHV